jgi:hypothetical protein
VVKSECMTEFVHDESLARCKPLGEVQFECCRQTNDDGEFDEDVGTGDRDSWKRLPIGERPIVTEDRPNVGKTEVRGPCEEWVRSWHGKHVMGIRHILMAAVVAAGLGPGTARAQQIEIRDIFDHPITDGIVRGQSTVKLDLDFGNVLTDAVLSAELTSSAPSVFPVPETAGSWRVEISINEPEQPTPVTVTASVKTPAGALSTATKSFTVYPDQRLASVRMIPAKEIYQIGDPVTVRASFRYAEPADDYSLKLGRPTTYLADGAMRQHAPLMPWMPSSSPGSWSSSVPIPEGEDHLDFELEIFGTSTNQPISIWHINGEILEGSVTAHQYMDALSWSVENEVPTLTKVALSPSSVIGGETLTGTLHVKHLPAGEEVQVSVSSENSSYVDFPQMAFMVQGVAGGHATEEFEIHTSNVPTERHYDVFARIGLSGDDNRAKAPLNLRPIFVTWEKIPRDLLAGELMQVELRLGRPMPDPTIVYLESTDRGVRTPGSVTFAPGETRKLIEIRADAELGRSKGVKLRARIGKKGRKVETRCASSRARAASPPSPRRGSCRRSRMRAAPLGNRRSVGLRNLP